MLHSFTWGDSLLSIVHQHFIKQIQTFLVDQMLILLIHKSFPRLSFPILKSLCNERFDRKLVFLHIIHKISSPHKLRYFQQLVIIIISFEHRILLKNHVAHRTPKRPNVQTVIIVKIINQQLRPFVVPRSYSDIIRFLRNKVLSKTPINDSKNSLVMVNHHIMRLDVSVHDAHRVAVIKPSQNFIDVKPAVEVCEVFVELAVVEAVDSFED